MFDGSVVRMSQTLASSFFDTPFKFSTFWAAFFVFHHGLSGSFLFNRFIITLRLSQQKDRQKTPHINSSPALKLTG